MTVRSEFTRKLADGSKDRHIVSEGIGKSPPPRTVAIRYGLSPCCNAPICCGGICKQCKRPIELTEGIKRVDN